MDLDSALAYGGIALEVAFAALLTRRRFYRSMPFFFSYIWFGVGNDLAMSLIQNRYPSRFLQVFIVQMCIDSALQYGILVELTWCVLRPIRASLPRGTVAAISLLVLFLGGAAWWLGNGRQFAGYPPQWHFLACMQQTTAILRIVFFLTLAAGSHFLALGWRDRELQVATGLGSFSIVSLAASVIHTHQKLGLHYHWVDLLVAASYAAALVYWIFSFARAEAPRREFTPQMRSVLTAVAAAARAAQAG